MTLDPDACYRALQARDARFDGRLFVGVRTTGVYCRPICPAPCPKRQNVAFYPSAAAAQAAGFRPCLRCRPECSPQLAGARGSAATVSRALSLIASGALDGGDVEGLALRLGIGARQLRRLFETHLGASPLAVAQTRRVLLAKQLLHETDLRMTDVAFAAGFGSLRRFNDAFRRLYGRPPSALRREREARAGGSLERSGITLTLGYAGRYDWDAVAAFLAARAVPGIEVVEPRRYRRTIALGGRAGTLEVAPREARRALAATIRFPDVRALPEIIRRVRALFDLGSDVAAIGAHLAVDPLLAPLVAARPGLRVPGAWDAFECAVRAVLGQQVALGAARALAARLAAACGEPCGAGPDGGLRLLFPTPERIAGADLRALGLPRARAEALAALARAAAEDPELFDETGDLEAKVARLMRLPGVGAWTAQYVAMRALREPDAFPAGDAGLLRAFARARGARPSPAALLARAERWRPWRAYAAQHLWSAGAARDLHATPAPAEAVA